MLVEREGELAILNAALQDAVAGHGSVLLLEGTAGIGKSALLGALAADVRTLRARCFELERPLAFGLVRQLFERLLGRDAELAQRALAGAAATARRVVAPDTEHPIEDVARLHHALTWLVANLTETAPLVLIADDLQWADAASLGWIEHLARRAEDFPVLVLLAWRIGEPGVDEDALDRLRDEPATTILRPAPLSADGVRSVVRGALPDAAVAVCEACARSTGGNPFLLTELVRTLAERDRVVPTRVDDVRPESVGRSVARRLARLGTASTFAAAALGVLGEGAELRHVAALAGLSQAEAAAAVDGLVSAGILTAGQPLAFAHPLLRSAVYERIGGQARATAHGRAARFLDAEGAEPGRIALHLLATPPQADPWVVERLLTAARQAMARGAAHEARTVLLRALQEPAAERRTAVLLGLVNAEHRLFHPDLRARVAELLADPAATSADRARAMIMQSVPATASGDLDYVDQALALADEVDDRELSLRLRAITLAVQMFDAPAEPAQLLAAADGLAGDTPGECSMLGTLAYHLGISGRVSAADAAAIAERAVRQGRADEVLDSPAGMQTVLALLGADRFTAIDTLIADARARAADEGAEVLFVWSSVLSCLRNWVLGDLTTAEADAYAALGASRWMHRTGGGVVLAAARVLIDRQELGAAQRTIDAAGLAGPSPPLFGRAGSLLAVAQLRAAQGRWTDAAEAALEIGRLYPRAAGGHLTAIPWRTEAAVALAMTGERAAARRLIAEQWPLTLTWDLPRQTGLVLRAEAIVESSIDLLRDAVAVFEASPARLELARTLGLLGAALRRGNRRAEARDVLRRALDLADRCGARRIATAARGELAATGARARSVRLDGVESLTPSELRVARMAAEGMSNPEIAQALFVTRKTIETHLGHVYAKLDVKGRADLQPALSTGSG